MGSTPSGSDDPRRAAPPGEQFLGGAERGEGEPTSGKPALRILVVDDLADAADSLALLLRVCGHEVRIAYDGPAALVAAEQFHPHVVLLDIGLPALDGYQVAQRLRQMPKLQRACLIAVSGYGQQADVEYAYQAGFDRHLLKPVTRERLTLLLAEIIARESWG
jgi:two-component system CheB/CheR fusion protein